MLSQSYAGKKLPVRPKAQQQPHTYLHLHSLTRHPHHPHYLSNGCVSEQHPLRGANKKLHGQARPIQHLDVFVLAVLRSLSLTHSLTLYLSISAGKKLPIKRAIKYNNLTIDGFSFELAYNASGSHGLPPGVVDAKLAEYIVSGIKEAVKRWVQGATQAGY